MEVLVPGSEKVGHHWSKGSLLDFHSLMWFLYFAHELGSPCFDVVMTRVLESVGYVVRQVCRWVYPLGWPRVHSCGAILEKFVEPGSSDFEALLSPEFICEGPVLWLEVMCWCGISCWPNILHTFHPRYYGHIPVFKLPNSGVFSFHASNLSRKFKNNILSVDSYSSLSGSMRELPVHILLTVYAILSISFPRSAGW